MMSHFKKVSISKLRIESHYDYKCKEKLIDVSDDQAGLEISIDEINQIRTLSTLEPIKSIFEENYTLCNLLNISPSDTVRWDLLIGKHKCQDYTRSLLKEISFAKEFLTSYHFSVLEKRKSLYQNLVQIADKEGILLEVPIYNHSSVSGRTSIKKGFNFLTSSKDFRASCKSTTPGNVLVSIDFKSCEPNLYLRALGKDVENPDVYAHLVDVLDIKIQNREKLKRGILSVLYGASDDTAIRILGGDSSVLKKIKEFFKVEETTKSLTQEYIDQGYIFNMYGRPIFSKRSIINKWIQSSAVDFCSLAFLNMAKTHSLDVTYLVHDEMVVDCSKEKYNVLKSINSITDPMTNISLPVEVTLLSR